MLSFLCKYLCIFYVHFDGSRLTNYFVFRFPILTDLLLQYDEVHRNCKDSPVAPHNHRGRTMLVEAHLDQWA